MINNNNSTIIQSLNEQQKEAVEPKTGVLIVCAGAGSGKTRVITSRITQLITNHNVAAYSIVALTFTNKAANEMKERVHKFLGNSYQVPYIGTFHSYCLRILKINSHLLPFSQFSLIDDDDQQKIIKNILNKFGLNKKVTVKQVLSFISRLKNECLTSAEVNEFLQSDPIFKEIYNAYEQEKKVSHCLDFDDLLIKTFELFKKNPEFKAQFQKSIRHLLVDEYQDTNKIQHALLKIMSQDEFGVFNLDSLCVVGDEDQSIYSWRGANVSNIVNFNKDFPQAKLITIEQNYRSVQPILAVANSIIKNNLYRNEKNLWSERQAQDRVRVISCTSGYQEGDALALLLKQFTKQNNLNNCAVLYRSHFQSRAIEEAFIRHSIPYKIIGGIQFYDRQEIKDLLAYLKLISNPYDRIAFSRIINCPTRGLGNKFEELFFLTWEKNPFMEFKAISELLINSSELTNIKKNGLKAFLDVFEGLKSNDNASEVLNTIIRKTSYFSYLKDSFEKDEAEIKKDNVKELLNGIQFFEEKNPDSNLDTFLHEVALLVELSNAKQEQNTFVRLMTLHAAKGLEFDLVMLSGIEENVLPSGHSVYIPESLEEERRLLYVGITRAKEHLLITYTRYRYTWGQMTEQRPSRFINELPDKHIQFQDCSNWQNSNYTSYFYDWLNQKKNLIENDSIEYQGIKDLEPKKSGWFVNQKISHAQFGAGVIEKVENKDIHKIHLTIRFGNDIKKLDAQFVKALS